MRKFARFAWFKIVLAAVLALPLLGGSVVRAQSEAENGGGIWIGCVDDTGVYQDILVRVKETQTGSFMIGAGINANAGLMGTIGFRGLAPAADLDTVSEQQNPARPRANPDEGKSIVADVVIEGNKHIDTDQIARYLLTCPGMALDESLLQQDVERLRGSGLFEKAWVTWTPCTDGRVIVKIEVTEHPQVEDIVFEHAGRLNNDDLRELARCCGLEKNSRPSDEANDRACRAIQEELVARGYYWAKVWLRAGGRHVVFAIDEGPLVHIRSINFSGNTAIAGDKLRARVDEKMLLLECTGAYEPHQADELSRDLEHLYQGKGYCEASVRHTVKFEATYDEAVVTFKVKEGRHYRVKDWQIDAHGDEVPAELASTIKLRKGEFYDESLARKDADAVTESFHKLGKLVTVNVELAHPDTGFVRVVYRVSEPQHRSGPNVAADLIVDGNPRVAKVTSFSAPIANTSPRLIEEVVYRNAQHLSQESLQDLTKLQKGTPLDPVANLLACKEIQEHLKNKGRYWAKVTLDEGNRLTDERVVFNIHEGPLVKVRSMTFAGNKQLASELLSRQLESTKTCLGALGIFSDAAVRGDLKKLEEFCRAQGYRDARVCRELSFSNDRMHVDVVFHINEGARAAESSARIHGATYSIDAENDRERAARSTRGQRKQEALSGPR